MNAYINVGMQGQSMSNALFSLNNLKSLKSIQEDTKRIMPVYNSIMYLLFFLLVYLPQSDAPASLEVKSCHCFC